MRGDPGGAYDHLIDAEREALSRAGRRVDKIALIKALREATGLGLAEAKRAVEGYLERRGGRAPEGSQPGPAAGRFDDLLDAERAAAIQEGRPLTRVLLIQALRGASGLGLRPARLAVADYLRRKGGEGLDSGDGCFLSLVGYLIAVTIAVGIFGTFAAMLLLDYWRKH